MRIFAVIAITLFMIPTFAFSELTEKDLEKIKEIIHSEVGTIQTNDIMIISAVISAGFFLLFGCILLVGAFRNRNIDKQIMILMGITLVGMMLCRISPLDAQKDRFGEIVCTGLTVVDDKDNARIKMGFDEDNETGLTLFDETLTQQVTMYASENLLGISVVDDKSGHVIGLTSLAGAGMVTVMNRGSNSGIVVGIDANRKPFIEAKPLTGEGERIYPKK